MTKDSAAASTRFAVERLRLPEEGAAWDAFARASADPHPFATRSWLENASRAAGAELDLWAVKKGSEWIAAVGVSYRIRAGKRVHFGLPLAAYSPWVVRTREGGHPSSRASEHLAATDALTAELRRQYRLLSFLLPLGMDDVRPFTWAGWDAKPRYTYVLDTAGEPQVTDSIRRHLRKGRESGCTFSADWDFDAFSSVFDETRRRQGFGIRLGAEAFRSLASALHADGLAWMASARSADGQTLSSQIVLSVPGAASAYMWTAGTRHDQLSSGVSSWLMVEIAAEAGRRGHAFWDLCGADYPSIARFKSELGGALRHYFQVTSPPSAAERVMLWLRARVSDDPARVTKRS